MPLTRTHWADRLDSTNDSISAVMATGTSGGQTPFRDSALAGTAVAIKASAGNLYGFTINNTDAGVRFLQFFDVAQGSVTVGTTVPDYEVPVDASSVTHVDLGASGITFATAITVAFTTTAGGATGATAAGFAARYK